MIVTHSKSEAIVSGFADTGNFTIKASSKAFRILSDNIYQNKIAAIIRELSTNAVDSHIEAKQDRPFEVFLPDSLDPTFRLRDYGTGISHNSLMRVYTTYFESTKEDSNDYNGTLGLGSKSPFSYVNTFTVSSYIDGKKNNYVAYISDQDTPSILFAGSEDTSEPNGLEISFPVQRKDVNTFRENARNILYWFGDKAPKIHGLGDSPFGGFLDKLYEGKDWYIYSTNRSYSGAYVCQANILYPINLEDVKTVAGPAFKASHNDILTKNIIFHVPTGDVNFAPSREVLNYDKNTVANIIREADHIYEEMAALIDKELVTETSKWKRTILYHDKFSSYSAKTNLYLSSVKKSWDMFNGDYTIHPNTKIYMFTGSYVKHNKVIACVPYTDKTGQRIEPVATEKKLNLTINNKIKFYTYTNELGGVTKFIDYRKNVIGLRYDGNDIFICGDKDSVAKTIESFGNPETIDLNNVLVKAKSTKPTAKLWNIYDVGNGYQPTISRSNLTGEFEPIDELEGYYLVVDNFSDLRLVHDKLTVGSLREIYNNASRFSSTVPLITEVYLFRKSELDKVVLNTKLKPYDLHLVDFITRLAPKVTTVDINSEVLKRVQYHVSDMIRKLVTLPENSILDNEVASLIQKCKKLPATSSTRHNTLSEIQNFNKLVDLLKDISDKVTPQNTILDQIDIAAKDLEKLISDFRQKYPLVSSSGQTQNMVDYINAMSYYRSNLKQPKANKIHLSPHIDVKVLT